MKTLPLTIHAGDELPIYRQITQQIVSAIAGGRLAAGGKLPSHRDLALQLVIAPLTVKKAYDELERQGHIETRRGRGTFVVAGAHMDRDSAKLRLRPAADQLLSQAYLAGLSFDELVAMLAELARAQADRRAQTRKDT